MGGNNRKDLKAYVRYDGSGRVVAGSLILRRKMPKVGKWVEISAYECCDPFVPTSTSSTTTTTTTSGGGSYAYIVELGYATEQVCSGFGTIQTLYSSSSTLGVGSDMYYDSELTSPYFGYEGDMFAYGGIVYFFDQFNRRQILYFNPCTTTTTSSTSTSSTTTSPQM